MPVNYLFRTILILSFVLIGVSFASTPIKTEEFKSNPPLNVRNVLADLKTQFDADEILAVVMDSESGEIITMESSNPIDPLAKEKENKFVEYSHEPGGVMKPIVFSLLLDKGLAFPKELIDCHDGKYTLGPKTIVDETKFKIITAEEVIVYSSNIGIVQLAQRLEGKDYTDGLSQFGFGRFSGIDLPNEKSGSIPSSEQLSNFLYKAIVSYGYGVNANLIQTVKAYNAFNNNGRMVTPSIKKGKANASTQVISPATAKKMKQVLIKVVEDGTGTIAKTQGLEIGGKTGTVFIAKDGKYGDRYNTSFVGFANDDKHNYTIGIMVLEPKKVYYASITAVPVFKAIVDMMVKEKYLVPAKSE